MNTRMLIAAAAACVLLTAGCAGAGDSASDSASPTPSGPEVSMAPSSPAFPGASPSPQKPQVPGKDEVTVTGMVEFVDLEGGCWVLRAEGNKTYEIKGGDPGVLKSGARVTIRGKIRSDLMTICQMGPVLEVISSQPA